MLITLKKMYNDLRLHELAKEIETSHDKALFLEFHLELIKVCDELSFFVGSAERMN